MNRDDRVYLVSCVFCAAFALGYCAGDWFDMKLPRYVPLVGVAFPLISSVRFDTLICDYDFIVESLVRQCFGIVR